MGALTQAWLNLRLFSSLPRDKTPPLCRPLGGLGGGRDAARRRAVPGAWGRVRRLEDASPQPHAACQGSRLRPLLPVAMAIKTGKSNSFCTASRVA